MADGTERAGEAVTIDRFFHYLERFNAIAFFLLILGTSIFVAGTFIQDRHLTNDFEDSGAFGSGQEKINSIIGHPVGTHGGQVVAYYEADDDFERQEEAGVVLVDPATGRQVMVAQSGRDLVVKFEFLFDQGDKDQPAIGYLAAISNRDDWEKGIADLVIGALPAMTRNVVATNVQFIDLPTVRSDGSVGVILWDEQSTARVVAFNLSDGSIIDQASLQIPPLLESRVSQGPGKASEPELRRDPNGGMPPADFGYVE
ncbi:hypothetical protein [Qipengyuania vesicularis]|uniref:hypothetical protein n=1 Tax=Qipengyuania vesicularis TaxID=2867232 RepID=UPI001C88263D|nr:hypothetical protein [Qipengyuania vesicularis]MBX7527028.1 hypothetical protein [Qipengyuania vesicularis]